MARYASMPQIRRRSKEAFGGQYRLEALLAADALRGRQWTKTMLLEQLVQLVAPDDDGTQWKHMPPSSLQKELAALRSLGTITTDRSRDPETDELRYRTTGGRWVMRLVEDLDLDVLASVTDLPTTGSG